MDAEARRLAVWEHISRLFELKKEPEALAVFNEWADAVAQAAKEKVLQVASLMAQLAQQDEEIAQIKLEFNLTRSWPGKGHD